MKAPFPLCTTVGAVLLGMSAFPWLVPQTDRHHAGIYAVFLLLGLFIIGRRIFEVSRSRSIVMTPVQSAVRADAIAGAGAALVGVAALLASLLAPETRTIIAGPQAQVDVPYHPGCKADFPMLDASGAQAAPVVTCAKESVLVLAGGRMLLGSTLVTPVVRDAFSVEIQDASGARQTVTRPQGGGFLAPVFIFAQSTTIAGEDLPADIIAVPAKHLRLLGFFVDTNAAHSPKFARVSNGRPGVLVNVQDENGKSLRNGIVFVGDGATAQAGGLTINGRRIAYPALRLTSVSAPFPTLVGSVAFLGAAVSGFLHRRRSSTRVAIQ